MTILITSHSQKLDGLFLLLYVILKQISSRDVLGHFITFAVQIRGCVHIFSHHEIFTSRYVVNLAICYFKYIEYLVKRYIKYGKIKFKNN